MLGIVFALVSSFSFSVNTVLARRGLARASASAGAFVTVMIGVPMFLIAALVTGQLFDAGEVPLTGYVQLSAAGILHFGLGRYCNYRAISAIGATRTGPVQALTIPYAVLIAFLFLGETINPAMAGGIALVLVGPAMMVERVPVRAVRGLRGPNLLSSCGRGRAISSQGSALLSTARARSLSAPRWPATRTWRSSAGSSPTPPPRAR